MTARARCSSASWPSAKGARKSPPIATDSVTICAFTSDPTEAPLIRLRVEPDASGLREVSSLMVDKITTVPRTKLGEHVGRLSDEDMVRLGRVIVVFLGLAGS